MDFLKTIVVLGIIFANSAYAIKYADEAKNISGNAKKVNTDKSSAGYADMDKDKILFKGISTPKAGIYTLTIRYKAANNRACDLKVNGSYAGNIDFEKTSVWSDVSTTVALQAGENTIALEKLWGWISVDFVEISDYKPIAFMPSARIVIPNAIIPNKLVSSKLKAYTGNSTTDYLTDGHLTNWKNSDAKEIALNVGAGPTKLRINWESYGDCAWATDFTSGCGHSGVALSNFKIMTSANSTNGNDGDWTEAASVRNNPVMARGIDIDFSGKSWFKFVSEGDVGQLLEIEAFDMSNGGNDTWFFMGTSISQMGIKQQDTDSTTAQLIHARFPKYTPAMLRGGIGCINSTEVVNHLKDYLKYAGNVKFWAIEMGTNDAWGGGDWNLETFRNNMQTIIDSAKAHNITPIIARIIATDSMKAGWQVNPAFLNALDKLVEENNLPKGPDFYSYFKKHPEKLGSDGVHPNAETKGGQAMHHLWAEALAALYAVNDSANGTSKDTSTIRLVTKPLLFRGDAVIKGIFDLNGQYLSTDTSSLPKGRYILHSKVQGHSRNVLFTKN